MSTTVHGEDPDVAEGSSVDPIIAQPLKEQAPSQAVDDSTTVDEEALYQWFKDAQNSLPNIQVAPGNYKLSLQSVEEIERLWEQSLSKQPMMEKMFRSAMGGSLPAATITKGAKLKKTRSLQRGLSFCVDSRKLMETYDKWLTFLKQLHERRRRIYKIVNDLHDHRLSEQKGILNDIEQGFGHVKSDSKDLKQLQLEQTKIKDYPDRLKECQTVLEKILSMPKPVLVTMKSELAGGEDDKQILDHYLASFELASEMLERCDNLSSQLQTLFSNLKRKIDHQIDEILFQIDELNDWLEDTYKLFTLEPNNLSHADNFLLVDWQKKFAYIKMEYGESSFLDSTLLPGESSVDVDASAVDWEQEAKHHTAECILNMITDVLSVHKLEAKAHKLELCLARGNLISMETDVSMQLSRIQFLWQHLKEYGDLRIAELNFAIKMQRTFELISEGQDELKDFEEEYFDLDHNTLENELIDFQAFFYEIDYFTSLEKIRDKMCEYLEVYLSLCSFSTELKVSEDVLKGEVENMKHKYEDMMIIVNSQRMFFENGMETVKDLHEAIKLFEGWLTATEEVVFRDFYGSSYQELCAYYETVKSFLGDLIPKEESFEALMRIANTILEQCSDDVEKELSTTMETLKDRWVTVSDIIVNLEISIYAIIELWAAYERQYVEIQTFIDDMSNKIQKEPLESSHGDISVLPKYKTVSESIVKYRPQYKELISDFGQKLANHDKLGTKEKIEADMDKLKMQWEQLCDNVTASIESLQQELADWFSTTFAQLETCVNTSNQMLQQIFVVVSVSANFDVTLGSQLQSANSLIEEHSAVFSEEKSQEFYQLLDKVFARRPPHDLDGIEVSELDFEPLSLDNIAKTEALQTTWNDNWELGKQYLLLLRLRVKVLEYMTAIQDGQAFCSIQFDTDLESLDTALHNYENKFNEEYFESLQSLMEQMHQVADKLAKSFPYSESKVPQGDTQEATFNMLQESFDSLTSTINEKRKMLQHYIILWHNYNDLKEDVSTIIKDVEGSVDKLKESLHDPAVPPTTVVDNAKELKLEFESNAGKNQSFNAAKEELAEILEENAIVDNQITEEVMQISTDWHNLMVSLNQFVSQATQHSEEFISFVTDINKLAVEISNLKKSVEKEVNIDLPERDNQDYARRMIERRDILEALQCKCKEFQEKRDKKIASGVSWQPTKIPAHLLVEFPSEFRPDDEADGEDSDWLVHNHFDVLAEQMAALQAQLDKREDKLEKNEETVLIFKGLSSHLLKWLEQQLTLPVINKLPDANQEQLEEDIEVLQSLQKQLEGKIKEDKAELDEQRAKLEGRNLREDTRQEIQQIANHVDEIRNDLERKVAEQLAKFNEAKHNLSNFLVAVHAFEEWLNETEAELEACWPLGADLQLLLEKGVYINEKVKNAVDDKLALPNSLFDTEESIRPLFDPGSHSAISVLPDQLKNRYNLLVDDCEEKIEHIEEATNELQKFMVTYDKFAKWLEATLSTVITITETKHSVGVTESKLEEHKEFVAETIEIKVGEFEELKRNAVTLEQKYPPPDWLEGKIKEICASWDEMWSCCDKHKEHLEWLLERWITYERTVSELLDWVMTEAEKFAEEVTTRGDKGVVDHIKSCEELHHSLEDKNTIMDQVIVMSEELAEHDVRKENGTDDISSRKNDVVQHWDSLINLLAETLLRLEATYAELRHVLQVLEEESDLIGGLETRAALPPTCRGNTDILSQQIEHFQAVLVETESHNDKISYLNGYLDFVEEHSCKIDREPRQQEIKDVFARHAGLIEQSSRVLTVGRQALPIWQEYNETTIKLSDWMTDCHQKLCSSVYQSGNALTTRQSLENCKILLGEIVSQQVMVEDTNRQSSVLTTYCLTEDDKQFLAHSTTQHVDNYQELLEACRERVLFLEHRELTWQSFPVAEATVVQELVENVDEAVNVEFTDDTMAADMYGYLEQLEELESKQEENENTVAIIGSALNKEEVQKASQENPDINEEKERLLAKFAASKARLKEKLARVKVQVKAVTQLEDAINTLEACIDNHRAIVMSDLPVGAILETEHEKLKEAGVHSQAELASALENLDIVLMQFNQPEGEIQIQMPPDLNRRVKSLQEACPELLEAGDQWPTKIEETLATWIDLKGDIEKLSSWIATAESEFGSIQNIPKFLMDFNALEDRFQIHADNLEDQKEKYTAFITAIRPHLDSTEEVVVPFSTKVNKLSHRWDELNKELGELEQAMVPWRQLLDSRDALEHFLTPLEELFEVECANTNQLPLGSDFTPFIVQFKDSLRRMGNNEKLLSELQEKVEANLTEEIYKKHASARKLHQLYEQLVTRWKELKNNLNEMLESIQLKQKHELVYKELKESPHTEPSEGSQQSHQTTLDSMVSNPKKYALTDYQQVKITDALVSFIAGNLLPLSTVESPHFHDLMNASNPKYQVPTRKTLSTKLLPSTKSKIQGRVQNSLQKAESVCVTVDLWSNRQMRSYFGMTAHFIMDWSMQSVMLACSRFHGSHTGDAIAEEYERVVASFHLTQKLSFVITDSASNMIKALSLPGFEKDAELLEDEVESDELEEEQEDNYQGSIGTDAYSELNQHIPCFAHVLQLVIKDGFQQASSINEVLSKVSTIVKHVRKSVNASEILGSEKRLQTANVTRWNSQLKMIRSVLRVPDEKLTSLDTQTLTVYDRKVLEDLVEILTPFETATHCVQGDNIVTSSMIVPCVKVLKSKVELLSRKYTSRFVATLKASVNSRLGKYEDIHVFLMASALDPRFKLKWCKPVEFNHLKAVLIKEVQKNLQDQGTDMAIQTSNSSNEAIQIQESDLEPPAKKMKTFFNDLIGETASSNSIITPNDITLMVEEYLLSPCLPQEENPLEFWKLNQVKYSPLAKLASQFLCVPASSAPVERLFSIAGKVFRPERCRLTDKRFEELMFIRCNQ